MPDISKWNIDNAKNFCGIFSDCSLLNSLPDISKWFNKSLQKKDVVIDLNAIKFDYQINEDHHYHFEKLSPGMNLSYMLCFIIVNH